MTEEEWKQFKLTISKTKTPMDPQEYRRCLRILVDRRIAEVGNKELGLQDAAHKLSISVERLRTLLRKDV